MTQKLIVFDIDGTLADVTHRINWVQTKPANWAAFNAAMVYDGVNEPVVSLYKSLRKDNTILLASGRGEESRKVTEDWLAKFDLLGYEKLYMRPEKDYRSDYIIKFEILQQIKTDYNKNPDFVFDDRPQVKKMWQENGIFVFDCYQGTEDF